MRLTAALSSGSKALTGCGDSGRISIGCRSTLALAQLAGQNALTFPVLTVLTKVPVAKIPIVLLEKRRSVAPHKTHRAASSQGDFQ
jgi:hypothetical protein